MALGMHGNRGQAERVLNAYLLGRLDFDDLLALQRRLVYDVSGERSSSILLMCEHSPGITIGRQGSAAHIHMEADDLQTRGWPVRWVNRGGGCLLSMPGQISLYPILALDHLGLNVQAYLDSLHAAICAVLRSFQIAAEVRPGVSGVWVGDRQIAHVGVAVREWVSCFGCTVNVDPNLKLFRHVACDGEARPMTSIEREHRGRIRAAAVRQRLLAEFVERFQFDRMSLFHHHPALLRKAPAHAVVTRSC